MYHENKSEIRNAVRSGVFGAGFRDLSTWGGVLAASYPTSVKGDGTTISQTPTDGKDDVVLSAITGDITETSEALVKGKTVYTHLYKLLYQNKQVKFGFENTVSATAGAYNVVAYGANNTVGAASTVALGVSNTAENEKSIAIGVYNKASGNYAIAIGTGIATDLNAASGEKSIAIGYHNTASGKESIALGQPAEASGDRSVAIGCNAQATSATTTSGYAGQNVAVGASSAATNFATAAFGASSKATGWGAVAIGYKAEASGNGSIAIGNGSIATELNTVSVGGTDPSTSYTTRRRIVNVDTGTGDYDAVNLKQMKEYVASQSGGGGGTTYTAGNHIDLTDNKISVTADGTITSESTGLVTGKTVYGALQNNKLKSQTYTISKDSNTVNIKYNDDANTTAFTLTVEGLGEGGGSASGTGENSLQIGKDAEATKKNSIAIGVGAKAMGDNSIAIGAGAKATEDNVVSVGAEGNERKIINVKAGEKDTDAVNKGQMDKAIDEALANAGVSEALQESIDRLDHDISKVGAGAAALAALHPENYDPNDKWSFAVGYGHYRNANAGALGAFFKPNADTTVSIGSTIGNGNPMLNAGVSFKLGRRGAKLLQNASNSQLVQEVNALRADNNRLRDDSRAQAEKIERQAEKIERLEAQVATLLAKVENR